MESSYSQDDIDENVSKSHDVTFAEDFIVFDVETTGFDLNTSRIIQLAMIRVSTNGVVKTFCQYFNPCLSREDQLPAYKVHSISPDILLRKKKLECYLEEIVDFIKGVKYFVGHNVCFDYDFLQKEISRAGGNTCLKEVILIDTLRTSIFTYPSLKKFTLGSLAEHLHLETFKQPVVKYGLSSPSKNKKEMIKLVDPPQASLHDALTDAMITKEVFDMCLSQISNTEGDSLSLAELTKEHPEFAFPIRLLELTDKLLDGQVDESEKSELLNFAETIMSTLPRTSGKIFKNINSHQLLTTVQYLENSSKTLNDRRHRVLMELILSHRTNEMETLRKQNGSMETRVNMLEVSEERKRKETMVEYFPQKKSRLSEESNVSIAKDAKESGECSKANTSLIDDDLDDLTPIDVSLLDESLEVK